MPDQILEALYETKRQSFLIGFVQNPDKFDQALAFAYYHRLAPVFHNTDVREAYGRDPFENVYSVKADFINEVLSYLDENWGHGPELLKNIAFYRLESKFGNGRADRMDIRLAIEYARVSGRFGDEVFDAVTSDAPVEAKHLAAKFKPEDVYFG